MMGKAVSLVLPPSPCQTRQYYVVLLQQLFVTVHHPAFSNKMHLTNLSAIVLFCLEVLHFTSVVFVDAHYCIGKCTLWSAPRGGEKENHPLQMSGTKEKKLGPNLHDAPRIRSSSCRRSSSAIGHMESPLSSLMSSFKGHGIHNILSQTTTRWM